MPATTMGKQLKSRRHIAPRALAATHDALRCYAHQYSPQKDTQPQPFASLVLNAFFKTDCDRIVLYLGDLPELAATLDVRPVSHWTTLQKAAGRMLRRCRARGPFCGTIPRRPSAIDTARFLTLRGKALQQVKMTVPPRPMPALIRKPTSATLRRGVACSR
jgi:hypothetical protein